MKGFVEKCCPCCGKYFIDLSRNSIKETCSPRCRHEFYSGKDGDKYFERKIKIRINTFRLNHNLTFTPSEIDDIKQKIKIGKCEICGQTFDMRHLAIDHDHATNKYRGVICSTCNWLLGYVHDDPALVQGLLQYLDKFIQNTDLSSLNNATGRP